MNKPVILVVEDEKPINDLIEMNLTEAGYDYDAIQKKVNELLK